MNYFGEFNRAVFKNAIPSRVYVMQGPNKTIKIGRSKNPQRRARELSGFAGGAVTLVFQTDVRDDASCVEAEALKLMSRFKRWRDEWFVAKPGQAVAAMQRAIVKSDEISAAIEARARRSRRTKVWSIVLQERWPRVPVAPSSANYTSQLAFEF